MIDNELDDSSVGQAEEVVEHLEEDRQDESGGDWPQLPPLELAVCLADREWRASGRQPGLRL